MATRSLSNSGIQNQPTVTFIGGHKDDSRQSIPGLENRSGYVRMVAENTLSAALSFFRGNSNEQQAPVHHAAVAAPAMQELREESDDESIDAVHLTEKEYNQFMKETSEIDSQGQEVHYMTRNEYYNWLDLDSDDEDALSIIPLMVLTPEGQKPVNLIPYVRAEDAKPLQSSSFTIL